MSEWLDAPDGNLEDLRALAWLPGEFAAAGMEDISRAQQNGTKWMDINVPILSGYFAPVRAGQLVTIIGQASMGKSLLLHYLEAQMAEQLGKEGRNKEAIFHVSVEEPIEDMAMLALARRSGESVSLLARGQISNAGKLQMAANEISGTPIIYVAESISSRRNTSGMIDALNLTNVFNAIRDICAQTSYLPAAICIDYLQALPIDPRLAKMAEPVDQRRLQVRADVYFCRRAGLFFACPMFLAVQAKQSLGGYYRKDGGPIIQMPGMYDGEESSSIAQRSDRILSTCIPARLYPVGTTAQLGGLSGEVLVIDDPQMLVKVVKQRGMLPAGKSYLFNVDFDTGILVPSSL